MQDIVPPAPSQRKLSNLHWWLRWCKGLLNGNFEEFGTQKTWNLRHWWKDGHSVSIISLKRILKDPNAEYWQSVGLEPQKIIEQSGADQSHGSGKPKLQDFPHICDMFSFVTLYKNSTDMATFAHLVDGWENVCWSYWVSSWGFWLRWCSMWNWCSCQICRKKTSINSSYWDWLQ